MMHLGVSLYMLAKRTRWNTSAGTLRSRWVRSGSLAWGDNGVDLHAADVGLADERGVSALGGLMIQPGSDTRYLLQDVRQIRHLSRRMALHLSPVTTVWVIWCLWCRICRLSAIFSSTCWAFVIPTMWKPVPAYVLCTATRGTTLALAQVPGTEVCIT